LAASPIYRRLRGNFKVQRTAKYEIRPPAG
jgi:hypothetical protein